MPDFNKKQAAVKLNTAAITFYEHMGFRLLEDRITHYFMEWVPPSMQGTKLYFPGQGG